MGRALRALRILAVRRAGARAEAKQPTLTLAVWSSERVAIVLRLLRLRVERVAVALLLVVGEVRVALALWLLRKGLTIRELLRGLGALLSGV